MKYVCQFVLLNRTCGKPAENFVTSGPWLRVVCDVHWRDMIDGFSGQYAKITEDEYITHLLLNS